MPTATAGTAADLLYVLPAPRTILAAGERKIINAKQALQAAREARCLSSARQQIIDEKVLHVESLVSQLVRNRGSGVLFGP